MTLEERWLLSKRRMGHAIEGLEEVSGRCKRLGDIAIDTRRILDEFDDEFCSRTRLTGRDWLLVIFAVVLQVGRQYLTEIPLRKSDQHAAEETFGHGEEHSNRCHRYYAPSLEEIIKNPVPFDANVGAEGALSGGGRLGHRVTALGHDPILGLIIGTANIATATLTTRSFDSYHIKTAGRRDAFAERASTSLVLMKTAEKLISGREGAMIVGTSLLKEIVHLNSDVNSKNSLPFPMVSVFDAKLASELANYGLDMGNLLTVSKQATLAELVNLLVSMLHRLMWRGGNEDDLKLYEVKTRKIVCYSNVVAQSENLGYAFLVKNPQKIDIGGLLVCLWRLFTDVEYIRKVKREFIFGKFKELVENC